MELKACPFCASGDLNEKTRMESYDEGGRELYQGYVECEMCGARGPGTAWHGSREHAMSALRGMHNDEGWNTRPTADLGEDGELVESLRETLTVCQFVLSKPDLYDAEFEKIVSAAVKRARAVLSRSGG